MTSDLKKGFSCISKDGEKLDRQRAVKDNHWMRAQHLLSRGRCSAPRWPGQRWLAPLPVPLLALSDRSQPFDPSLQEFPPEVSSRFITRFPIHGKSQSLSLQAHLTAIATISALQERASA